MTIHRILNKSIFKFISKYKMDIKGVEELSGDLAQDKILHTNSGTRVYLVYIQDFKIKSSLVGKIFLFDRLYWIQEGDGRIAVYPVEYVLDDLQGYYIEDIRISYLSFYKSRYGKDWFIVNENNYLNFPKFNSINYI